MAGKRQSANALGTKTQRRAQIREDLWERFASALVAQYEDERNYALAAEVFVMKRERDNE